MHKFLVFLILFFLGCSTPSNENQITQTSNSKAYTKRDFNFCRDWVLTTDQKKFADFIDKTRQIGSKWTSVDDDILRQATQDLLGVTNDYKIILDVEAHYIATIERCFRMFPRLR